MRITTRGNSRRVSMGVRIENVAPDIQASGVSITGIDATSLTINYTDGDGSSRIVLMKAGASTTTAPADGMEYTASSTFGSGNEIGTGNYVVKLGSGPVTVTGLTPSTQYAVAVYELNGSGATTNYRQSSPATGEATTLANTPTVQASNVVITVASLTSLTINWTDGNGSSRIVLMKAGSAVDSDPVDGTAYTASSVFGSGSQIGTGNYVVKLGSGPVTVTGLSSIIGYFIAVYEFSGTGISVNYLQTSPAIANNVVYEPLIITSGESNSGGAALNSKALSSEIGPFTAVKIFNNTTLTSFDPIQMGVNNLIGHLGFGNPLLYHGWELQMVQRVLGGTFNSNPTYLVKTGNGGTKIFDWRVGGTYMGVNNWQTMQDRIDAAIALRYAAGVTSVPIIFFQIGINDSLGGTNITTFTNDVIAHFAKIRVKYPTSIIIYLKPPAAFTGYSAAIDDIVAGSGPNTYSVSSDGASVGEVDQNHYTYAGQKQNSNALMDKSISIGAVTGTAMPARTKLTWGQMSSGVTDNGDGTLNLGSTLNRGGTATTKLTNTPSYVQYTRSATGMNTVVMSLTSVDDGLYVYTALAGISVSVFEFNGLYYYYTNTNSAISTGRAPATGDIIRFERVNSGDIVLKISSNAGAQFTDIITFTGLFTGIASLTIKGMLTTSGTSSKLNLGFGYNQS